MPTTKEEKLAAAFEANEEKMRKGKGLGVVFGPMEDPSPWPAGVDTEVGSLRKPAKVHRVNKGIVIDPALHEAVRRLAFDEGVPQYEVWEAAATLYLRKRGRL